MTRYELSPDLTVHVRACEEVGIFVNAYLVETRNAVVAAILVMGSRGRLTGGGLP